MFCFIDISGSLVELVIVAYGSYELYKWGIRTSSKEGHRDLLRLSPALQHGTEPPVNSNHPREAAASTSLAIILGRIVSGVPKFDSGANAAPVSVQALSAMQALMLAVVAWKQSAIEC